MAAAAALAVGCAAPVANGAFGPCGIISSGGVEMMFGISHASNFGAHFPAVPQLPELAGDQRPATIRVFRGPVEVLSMHPTSIGTGAPATPKAAGSAVCVQIGNDLNVYEDLDLTGAHP